MDASLRINDDLSIPLAEIELRASRSSGPGGQHANVTSSRIEAVFDVEASPSLSQAQKRRIRERAGALVTAVAQDARGQARNRELALQRLADLAVVWAERKAALQRLLDGDLASNHLSWQWVAGTGSHKPYVFNADNVTKYAPPDWDSPGSAIDTDYETLLAAAHSPHAVPSLPVVQRDAVIEPPRSIAPEAQFVNPPDPALVAGRSVWLVHPWALGEPPRDLPADCLRVGWWPQAFHNDWPWSSTRWAFLGQRMGQITPFSWFADEEALSQALANARSVHTLADPHVDPFLPRCVTRRPADELFEPVQRSCTSFSQWWTRTTRHAKHLHDLPGLGPVNTISPSANGVKTAPI